MLGKERRIVDRILEPIYSSCKYSSVSVVSDGWIDCACRLLLNVTSPSPVVSMFISAQGSSFQYNISFIDQFSRMQLRTLDLTF